MSVQMTGQVVLPEKRQEIWLRLNEPEMLKRCIPGCESVERQADGFAVTARIKIGPVKASFRGRVVLHTIEENCRYRIEGRGDGGVAGFAAGTAQVLLEDCPEGCVLHYEADAQVGGKIAQLGSRLVKGIAHRNAEQFFENFLTELERDHTLG